MRQIFSYSSEQHSLMQRGTILKMLCEEAPLFETWRGSALLNFVTVVKNGSQIILFFSIFCIRARFPSWIVLRAIFR
jgi:hypothetical protein